MYAEESKSRPSQDVKNGGYRKGCWKESKREDNEAGVDSKLQQ